MTEDDSKITLKKKKIEYLDPNHGDALVVSMRMINAQMKRVMIDTSNSANIVYFDTFQKLKLLISDLAL